MSRAFQVPVKSISTELRSPAPAATPTDPTRINDDLTFRYSYDGANNLLTKKVPDADLVTYKYNTRDQLVLTRDGNLAASSKRIASVYDDYGRVTATGYWSGGIPSPISPTGLSITAANELTKAYYDGYDGSAQTSLTTAPQYRGKVRKSLARVLDGSSTATWLATTNSYDAHGRLIQTSGNNYQNSSNASSEVMTMTYDWADNPLAQTRVHKPSSSVTRTLTYRNEYDAAGRRSGYFLKVDGGTEQLLADYGYDERDLLRVRGLHGKPVTFTTGPTFPAPALASEVGTDDLVGLTIGSATRPMTYLQTLDYTYNAQGWLTGINQLAASGTSTGIKVAPTAAALPNPSDPARTYGANDLFGLELRYDQLLSGVSGTARKDGNIAQVIWRTRGRERQAYSASYDYLSRMSVASYYDITDGGVVSSDQKFKEEVTYADARGNIATLKRNGMYPSGAAWAVGQIDNLTYGYTSGTNKLATVTEAASTSAAKPLGFNPGAGGTGYGYDKNGNLTKDTYKGTTAITYNYLNLPGKISFGSSKSITITYDATGRKLKKVTAGGAGAENYTQYYADGLEYKSTTLEAIYHEEGRLTPKTSTTWQYEYAIRDHLGNSRVTFADKNGDGKISVTNSASTNEVLQENHYTPFGLELGYAWLNDAALADSKYRYNGKEFNTDFGLKLNDYGARWYDPAVGRFASVDPLSDKMPGWSPYNYAFDNPLGFTDPDGRAPQGCCGGNVPYPVQKAMGQLQNQLTGIGNQLSNAGNKLMAGLTSARDFVVDKVVGNDNIGMAVNAVETAGLPAVNVGGNKTIELLGDAAGKVSPVLDIAEGIKILTADPNDPKSIQDGAKFGIELGVGIVLPAASIPVTVLINDARSEGGLTNPTNSQLPDAYGSAGEQMKSGNAHLQRAVEVAREQEEHDQ